MGSGEDERCGKGGHRTRDVSEIVELSSGKSARGEFSSTPGGTPAIAR